LTARTDDAFLLRFLRARKFDYDRSYTLLVNYYTIRAQNPEVFSGLKFNMVEHVFDSGVLSVLPTRDSLGRNVVYLRPGKQKQHLEMDIVEGCQSILGASFSFVLSNVVICRETDGNTCDFSIMVLLK
jgi:CRAL/TRIO, N-terminal domain